MNDNRISIDVAFLARQRVNAGSDGLPCRSVPIIY
jgi:hypothetical protein